MVPGAQGGGWRGRAAGASPDWGLGGIHQVPPWWMASACLLFVCQRRVLSLVDDPRARSLQWEVCITCAEAQRMSVEPEEQSISTFMLEGADVCWKKKWRQGRSLGSAALRKGPPKPMKGEADPGAIQVGKTPKRRGDHEDQGSEDSQSDSSSTSAGMKQRLKKLRADLAAAEKEREERKGKAAKKRRRKKSGKLRGRRMPSAAEVVRGQGAAVKKRRIARRQRREASHLPLRQRKRERTRGSVPKDRGENPRLAQVPLRKARVLRCFELLGKVANNSWMEETVGLSVVGVL